MLTDIKIRSAKPQAKPYRLVDGRGLNLLVHPNGGKYWQVRFRFNGQEQTVSLGSYPSVSLSDAREKLEPLKRQIRDGQNPNHVIRASRRKEVAARQFNFKRVSEMWFDVWSKGKNPRTCEQKWSAMERDLFPVIGDFPIADIGRKEVISAIEMIRARGVTEGAKRALQTSKRILDFAVLRDLRESNPLSVLRSSQIIGQSFTRHHSRVEIWELPELLREISRYKGRLSRYAMLLMGLTFVRTKELLGARWNEIDFQSGKWVVPAERMKRVGGVSRPHTVPLSWQSKSLLVALKREFGGGDYLFPGSSADTMSNMTLLTMLKRLGYSGKMTGHGWRGIASTVLHEEGFPHLVIERQLAHFDRDESSSPYNFAEYLDQRIKMMQWWADFLTEQHDFLEGL